MKRNVRDDFERKARAGRRFPVETFVKSADSASSQWGRGRGEESGKSIV